jgi:DNA-binding IclR family transcriptional regulator
VPVGTVLPLTAGSAAQVLLAWAPDGAVPAGSAFTPRTLAEVRRRRPAAPVRGPDGVVGAVSVSGPIERLTRSPGRLHAAAVLAAADELSRAVTTD